MGPFFSRASRVSRAWLASVAALVVLAIALAVACGPAGFQSATVIDSVRILGTRVDNDKSYARPGDVVTLEALTVDGRRTQTHPAVTYWIPFICENPFSDLYYACFAPFFSGDAGSGDAGTAPPAPPVSDAGGATDDGGVDGGATPDAAAPSLSPSYPPEALASLLQPGTDLTPFLPTGPYTFTVPAGIIEKHPRQQGIDPYGLIIIFNIACTGHVKVATVDRNGGPQQVPIGCYDDANKPLPPSDYVIGFTRVYVSRTKTNVNPRIAGFLYDGTEHDAGSGDGLPGAIDLKLKACDAGACPAVKLDMDVAPSSWTPESKKAVWVDYYSKGGHVGSEARLLYDVSAGRVSDTSHEVMYSPPDKGPATLWAVVHDSKDGVTWLQVNITVQ